MLGTNENHEECVIPSIVAELDELGKWDALEGWHEFYKIDYVIGYGETFLDYGYYPFNLLVLIEHENDIKNIEQEMYKLALFRSPLKVIITYYDEDAKQQSQGDDLVETKLASLSNLLQHCSSFCKEDPDTQYLFIVGNREAADSETLNWRAWKFDVRVNHSVLEPVA